MEFLEIKDLKKSFGAGEARQEVLRGMDFSVSKGEFCFLLAFRLRCDYRSNWTL